MACSLSPLGSRTISCGAIWGMGDARASSMEAYSATTWDRAASSRRTNPWRNRRCGSISRVGPVFIRILHGGNLMRRKPCVAAPGSEIVHKPTRSFAFFNPDKGFSGCGFELIAGLKVELGLDRVDLVGGNGRDDVNEGVDDGSMLGKVEG